MPHGLGAFICCTSRVSRRSRNWRPLLWRKKNYTYRAWIGFENVIASRPSDHCKFTHVPCESTMDWVPLPWVLSSLVQAVSPLFLPRRGTFFGIDQFASSAPHCFNTRKVTFAFALCAFPAGTLNFWPPSLPSHSHILSVSRGNSCPALNRDCLRSNQREGYSTRWQSGN